MTIWKGLTLIVVVVIFLTSTLAHRPSLVELATITGGGGQYCRSWWKNCVTAPTGCLDSYKTCDMLGLVPNALNCRNTIFTGLCSSFACGSQNITAKDCQ